MKLRSFLFVMMALVLVLSLATACAKPAPAPTPTPTPTPTKPIEFSFDTWLPATHIRAAKIHAPWLDSVEKAAGGKVHFTRNWGGSTIPFAEMARAVETGASDIGEIMYQSMDPGNWPYLDMAALPKPEYYPKKNCAVWQKLYDEQKAFRDTFAKVHFIAWVNLPPATIEVRKPVNKVADLKGLKLICTGKWASQKVTALGASPVNIPPNDVYMSLEKGVADGITWSTGTAFTARKLSDMCKYNLNVHVSSADQVGMLVMNLNKWNSLPPDVQKVFNDLGGWHYADFMDGVFGTDESGLLSDAKKAGVQFVDLSKEEMAKFNDINESVRKEFVDWATPMVGAGINDFMKRYDELCKEYHGYFW